jgi:hypothetical protein
MSNYRANGDDERLPDPETEPVDCLARILRNVEAGLSDSEEARAARALDELSTPTQTSTVEGHINQATVHLHSALDSADRHQPGRSEIKTLAGRAGELSMRLQAVEETEKTEERQR